MKPGMVAFAEVWGLDGWWDSEEISERMWEPSRAFEVKDAAHTWQQNFFVFFDLGWEGGGGKGGWEGVVGGGGEGELWGQRHHHRLGSRGMMMGSR